MSRWVEVVGFLTVIVALCLGGPHPVAAQGPKRLGDRDPVAWSGRAPSRFPVHGIDVARYQESIDWRQVRKAGIQFAFIKATEGGDLKDPKFRDHWRGAGRAGVTRGAYHFYYFCTSAAVQARWFIRNVPRSRGSLPPVLDMEWNPFSPSCKKRPPGNVVRREARVFLDMVEKHFGQRPIIYTTPEFFRETGIGKLRGTEFWLRSTAKTPAQAYPGKRWQFWQYSGTGIVPGIAGDVDLNVFNGTSADWNSWVSKRRQ